MFPLKKFDNKKKFASKLFYSLKYLKYFTYPRKSPTFLTKLERVSCYTIVICDVRFRKECGLKKNRYYRDYSRQEISRNI